MRLRVRIPIVIVSCILIFLFFNLLPKMLTTVQSVSVALLTVIVPVFVLAISLLGQALEKAKSEENRIKNEEKEKLEIKIGSLQKQLDEMKTSGDPTELQNQLSELFKQKGKTEKTVKRIKAKYSSLNFVNSVALPGIYLFFAAAFSHIAETGTTLETETKLFEFASILFMGLGIYKIARGLVVIEEVARGTEEFQSRKFKSLLKSTLEELGFSSKIQVELVFDSPKPPFIVKSRTNLEIKLGICLRKGNYARKVQLWLFFPTGFSVEGKAFKVFKQDADFKKLPNAVTALNEVGDLSPGFISRTTISVMVPIELSNYECYYYVTAEGYMGDYCPFSVIVE